MVKLWTQLKLGTATLNNISWRFHYHCSYFQLCMYELWNCIQLAANWQDDIYPVKTSLQIWFTLAKVSADLLYAC